MKMTPRQEMEKDTALLRVVEHARQLNHALDIKRLERMLFIYRSWIATASGSVEGGFSLTRDELDCVLEYPPQKQHLDFLMGTFQTKQKGYIDLLTLLVTCACLARGPLEAKARFLFQLVDFDTEDEIVEDELAMLIALSSDGLRRVGIVLTGLLDVDARAIACEAFEFVGIDDGGKMTLALFVQWLVFHWRPAALFQRIESVLLLSQLIQRLHAALQSQEVALVSSSFHIYNAEHLSSSVSSCEHIRVVVGPIVGPVDQHSVRVLLEVDHETTVRCFAFTVGSSRSEPGASERSKDRVFSVHMEAFKPKVLVLDGLEPCQTYQFRLLGVARSDRERCVAIATTARSTDESSTIKPQPQRTIWEMRAINHQGIGLNTEVYQRLVRQRLKAAEAKSAMLSIHFSAIQLDERSVSKLVGLLEDSSEDCHSIARQLVNNSFRAALNRRELFDLLRMQSNLLVTSRHDVVFRNPNLGLGDSATDRLLDILERPWRCYIGMLWGIDTDNEIALIFRDELCCLIQFDTTLHTEQRSHEHKCVLDAVAAVISARDLIVVSETPLLSPSIVFSISKRDANEVDPDGNANLDEAMQSITPLIEWKRLELARNVCLVSRDAECGFETRLSIKNTMISISQVVCGPATGQTICPPRVSSQIDHPQVTMSTTDQVFRPHYASIVCCSLLPASRPSSQVSSSRPTSRSIVRSSHGDRVFEATQITPLLMRLEDEGGIEIMTGPIVGNVTSTTATVSLECDRAGVITICTTDRFTGQTILTRVKTFPGSPVTCTIHGLIPARMYNIHTMGTTEECTGFVCTPPLHPASTRILFLGDHSFCDQTVSVRRSVSSSEGTSYLPNVLTHLAGGNSSTGSAQLLFDLTIRMGVVGALRHDLLDGYEITRLRRDTDLAKANGELEKMIRSCYQAHVAVPDYRTLLSRGAHLFSHIGITRSLLQNGAPIRLFQAVRRVLKEYEQADGSHLRELVHSLPGPIQVVMLDSTDCLLTRDGETLVQWPESLFTASQIRTLESVLGAASASPATTSSQVLLLCDGPIVWPFSVESPAKTATRAKRIDKVLEIAADPWLFYPHDVQALLQQLFSAMAKHPLLRITLICCGPFASRVVISDKKLQLSIEQLTVSSVSNVERNKGRPPVSRFTLARLQDDLRDDYEISGHVIAGSSLSSKQYCLLDVIPHSQGAVIHHKFYVAGRPEASLVLGPIIGRTTARTARILIEVDRPVHKASCVLTALASNHSVSAECDLEAFVPTIFKLEGLHPGTRYKIKLEGVITSREDGDGYVETPPLVPLSMEWLVFSRNNLRRLLPDVSSAPDRAQSHWHRILAPSVRFYNAQPASVAATNNGDTLGQSKNLQDETFNPWYHVEAFSLSEPLRQTQLSVHIGGQVDLSTAFTEEELGLLLVQLCDSTLANDARQRDLYAMIRDRLQDVYRTTFGIEPMRTILASSSNAMLLHEATDVFFSVSRLQDILQRQHIDSISQDDLAPVALKLRAMAFELWQLYQNQLSVDVNESDLDNSRRNSSKFASHVTLGLCKLVFLNVSDELRDLSSSAAAMAQASSSAAQTDDRVVPLTLPAAAATTGDKESPVLLLSSATWKTLDEALELVSADGSPVKTTAKAKGKKASASGVKQLAVFVPVDLIEAIALHPAIRADVTRLFEKLFQWKMMARTERNVTLVCYSDRMTSLTFKITDGKVNETLIMTRVGSISELQEISQPSKSTAAQAKTKSSSKSAAAGLIKGHFSKRFTYQSVPMSTAASQVVASAPTRSTCRSYAKYLYLSDYRRGVLNENVLCFPSRALPKILLGPVIGRIVYREHDPSSPTPVQSSTFKKITCSVPILIEVNAPARVTCVVVDSMINTEVRVTNELVADTPHIFCIHELTPLRRYVYFFEGISNGDPRRGSFHTPPVNNSSLNIVAVSSNFPRDMDEEIDSLWVSLVARATLPWCGLDAILHLGGQVPLHEAAVECFHWANRELQREILNGDRAALEKRRLDHVRTQVRRRFQQEYHVCWNLPNIRELLAHVSHWFVRGKADLAPFLGHDSTAFVESSQAARLVHEVANEVVNSYQINVGSALIQVENGSEKVSASKAEVKSTSGSPSVAAEAAADSQPTSDPPIVSTSEEPPSKDGNQADEKPQNETTDENVQAPGDNEESEGGNDSGGARYWQHESIAVFTCDTRNIHLPVGNEGNEAEESEPITCNGRLSRPLSRLENPMIGEQQWKHLESALRKKRTLLFILCLELPLILTNADHVEKLRDELRPTKDRPSNWKLYDHTHIQQHWVACKRQLEQLLLLLFKWKAKRSGRDVLVLSGGMRIGMETLLQDRETQLSIRNLTVGPITASVDSFEFPLSGVACATLSGGLKDDHFTFRHSLVAKNNYLLLQARVETPEDDSKAKKNAKQGHPSVTPGATIAADFVPNESAALSRLHPVDKFRRLPLWWTQYVPMGKAVFWDDTITLKSETDERMLALREYVWKDRGFSGALELFYEKYQFAETARMEELRSRHLQHVDLQANFVSVLADLWRAIPDTKRQQMAYFLDPFVREMLLDHVSPELFRQRLQSGEPIELAFFCRVIRDFVFDACLLRLTIETQAEDEIRAHHQATEQAKRDAQEAEAAKVRQAEAEAQELPRMAELLRTDPLQYAQIKLAQEETVEREKQARHDEKLARKKAERLAEMEEEQAIAKEQKKLDKLAERGDAAEYERRQKELDTRITRLKEKRAQRNAQKKAMAEKAETKAEETAGS